MKYSENEKKAFCAIFENLNNGKYYGQKTACGQHIDKRGFYYSDVLSRYNNYFRWTYFGSSCEKNTAENLRWILTHIFKMSAVEFSEKYTLLNGNEW